MGNRLIGAFFALILLLPLLTACSGFVSGPIGPVTTESSSIDQGNAKTVRAEITMGAGALNIAGGSGKLLDATFDYNIPAWKPELTYEVSGDRGTLTVKQPSSENVPVGEVKYDWTLKLNNSVPIDLHVIVGAGSSTLSLQDLSLQSLDMEMGAGESRLNLDGRWENDVTVNIRGGVGRLTIQLPRETGVQVEVSGGLGKVNAGGLKQAGNVYTNDAYGQAAVSLRITIQAGVGEINLQQGE